MATAIYLRQSRDRDGNELAVSRQREDCAKLCADRGWSDTVEYVDNNVSASNRRVARPAYRRMLADITAGRIDGVVVWDCDRLYRQPRELEDFIDLADERRLRLATVTGDVDLSTDNGRLFARIKGAVAKAEGERKSARWKRSNEQGAMAGKWTATHRPFGYTMTGEPQEPEASLLRSAYTDVLEGKSLRRIAVEWNEKGVPTVRGAAWTNNRIRRMLLNPRYAAMRVLRGEVVGKGTWTALVDEDTWRGVGALLRDPDRAVCTTFEVAHMGAGVYRCGRDGCGAPMKTHYDKHRKRSYRCKAAAHLVRRADPIDDLVTAWILERLSQPDAADVLVDPAAGVDVAELNVRREALVRRKGEVRAMFREGLLDSEEARRDLAVVVDRIADVDRRLADAAHTSPAAALVAAGSVSPDELMRRWDAMTPAVKGQAIDELATITVLPCPNGLRRFDPTYVRLRWRRDGDGGSQGTAFVDM